MKDRRLRALYVPALLVALAGCHFQTDPPDHAPEGVGAVAGDGVAVVSWNEEPDLTYWIFYQAGSSVTPNVPGVSVILDAVAPQVVQGLTNDTQYAFIMNSTLDDSRAGPNSSIVTATPRLAGVTWTAGAALGTAPQKNLNSLALNGTRLVAVGDSGAVFYGDVKYTSTAPPGVAEWLSPTSMPSGFVSNLVGVTYSTQFVAMGADGAILTSSDGTSWSQSLQPVPSGGMNAITYSGVYIAVGNGGKIYTSADLVTWSQPDSTTLEDLYGVAILNGQVLVAGANGTLLKSADAINWTAVTSNTASALRAVSYRASPSALYVAVGDAGTVVTSTDGVTWTPVAPPLAFDMRHVIFGSRFLAVGQGGTVAYSDDGSSWTETSASSADLSWVIFQTGMYLAVGAAGTNVVSK